jgi:acetyl-CoA carboxylase carboxyltransferase component
MHDVTGFRVGTRSEHGGIIKDGAKMVAAVSNSTVPKFSIVMANSNGAGNYAMCGKAYDPRLIVAWPAAKIAVMGGAQAAQVLLQIEKASAQAKGQEMNPDADQQASQAALIAHRHAERRSVPRAFRRREVGGIWKGGRRWRH